MTVLIPSPLHSYTSGVSSVELSGSTVGEVLDQLDARFPGIRFRIVDEHGRTRPHVHFFVGGQLARSLDRTVSPGDEIMIVCALSGG